MSRRRQNLEHSAHDRWLVSYADFITLLFAVFVVLYATSQVEQGRRMVKLGAAVQAAFRELGTFPGTDRNSRVFRQVAAGSPGTGSGFDSKAELDKDASLLDVAPRDLMKLDEDLRSILGDEIRSNVIRISMSSEGLVISLREIGFFPTGESRLLPSALSKLARLAKPLNESGLGIRVEGHTDNVPIHNAAFKSNWELSSARATEVVTLLAGNYGLDPRRLSVAGYAEFRPVAGNDTAEGRQMNRRVDLVVVSGSVQPPTGGSRFGKPESATIFAH